MSVIINDYSDVLLVVAIVFYALCSGHAGSIFYGSMSLYARTLRSAGTRIPTANKCLLHLCLSMQVSAMFSLQEMGSLASIVKDIPKLNDSNYEELDKKTVSGCQSNEN